MGEERVMADSEMIELLKMEVSALLPEAVQAELVALRKKNERLKEAMREYACDCETATCKWKDGMRDWCGYPAVRALGELK
jgi:rRNA-processing protein FCF1